jgi:flagellin
MAVINTNTKALFSQNALKITGKLQAKSMEQLSSGKRINTAGDDAAGLAISTRMTQQIRALNQAVRNAGDAISLIQTAEGATAEITNMMQRMRELAIQAINDTNSSPDRGYLDLEFQQLKQEVQRIAEMTEWNGFKVLDGTAGERVGEVPVYKATSVNLSGDVLINPTTDRNISGDNAGEQQKIKFSGTHITGSTVSVAGVSIQISASAAANTAAFATAVATALRNDLSFNSKSGRTATPSGDSLILTYAASDGDVPDVELKGFSSSSGDGRMKFAREDNPLEAIVTTREIFSGDATFIKSGTLAVDVPKGSSTASVQAIFTTTDKKEINMLGRVNPAAGTITFTRRDSTNREVFSGESDDTLTYYFRNSDETTLSIKDRAVGLQVSVEGSIPVLREGDLKINGIIVGQSLAADDPFSPRNNAAGSAIAKAAAINRVASSKGITVGESQTITIAGIPKEGVLRVGGVNVTITAAENTSAKVAAKVASTLRESHLFDDTTGRLVTYASGGSVINIDFPASEGDVGKLEFVPGTTNLVGAVDVAQEYLKTFPGTGVFAKVNENLVSGQAMDASSVVSGVVRINGYTSANITTTLNNTRETRQTVTSAINAISHLTGVRAVDTGFDSKGITLLARDGRNIEVTFETTFNEALFGKRIGLREGVQASTISLESKIPNPVILSSSPTRDIARAGLVAGNFTKNQSVYNSAPRELVDPPQAQVTAITVNGPVVTDGKFWITVNGQDFEAKAKSTNAQDVRSALVTAINGVVTLGVKATVGRNPYEILLTAKVPGQAYTVSTRTDSEAAKLTEVVLAANRPGQFTPLNAEELVINGVSIRPTTVSDDTKSSTVPLSSNRAASALAIAAAINSHSSETGVRALANGAKLEGLITDTRTTPIPETAGGVAVYSLYVNGIKVDVEFERGELAIDRREKVVEAINARTGQHGVTAKDNGFGLDLETDGRNLSVWFDAYEPGLSAAHFGLERGDAIAQQSRIYFQGTTLSSASVTLNGISIPRDPTSVEADAIAAATTGTARAAAMYSAIMAAQAKDREDKNILQNVAVTYKPGNTYVTVTSKIPGSPFELNGAKTGSTANVVSIAAVVANSAGSNIVTAIPMEEMSGRLAFGHLARTAYGTVRLISDSALLPDLPSPVGAPPSDRQALLRATAKPFIVEVGNRGFGPSSNFNALGFQQGSFGGRSSEEMDPPKVGRLAFQVGSSAYQLITIDLADFGKNGSITNDITGDVDLNVEERTARINTREGATNVLRMLDDAMDKINATRAQMGAVMNRLQYAMDNLSNVSMNQEASRSQILDADYAKASTELSKSQIMQQAATAVLAQANMSQQTVLQLLQG